MKFVILHGTGADSQSNWFPWLKSKLEELGHEVWVPDLPHADRPNVAVYNEYLLNQGYDFSDAVIVGHSSGSVEILGLLEALPKELRINTAILVGAFTKRLSESPSWEMLRELFGKPFEFNEIKQKSGKFIFIHSSDDPYCPIDDARELAIKLDGEFVEFNDMGHFSLSLDKRFNEFPEILEIIRERVLA